MVNHRALSQSQIANMIACLESKFEDSPTGRLVRILADHPLGTEEANTAILDLLSGPDLIHLHEGWSIGEILLNHYQDLETEREKIHALQHRHNISGLEFKTVDMGDGIYRQYWVPWPGSALALIPQDIQRLTQQKVSLATHWIHAAAHHGLPIWLYSPLTESWSIVEPGQFVGYLNLYHWCLVETYPPEFEGDRWSLDLSLRGPIAGDGRLDFRASQPGDLQ